MAHGLSCSAAYGIFPDQGSNRCLLPGRWILYHWALFSWAPKSLQMVTAVMKLKDACSLEEGFPHSSVGKESACNAKDPSLIPRLGRSAGEGVGYPFQYSWASLVAQLVKNLHAMWKTWVWKIPWRRERLPTPVFWPGEFQGLCSPWDCRESDMTDQLSLSFSLEEKLWQTDSILKSRDITLPSTVHLIKAVVFPVVMLWMWELDHKGSWVVKNWCFWTVVLEKT